MDAKNVPVKKPAFEVNTGDLNVGQRASIMLGDLNELEDLDRDELAIVPGMGNDSSETKSYFDELLFNEEPVTIYISPSNERYPAKVIPCWCQGRGAEVLIGSQWIVQGWLPVGVTVTTKRKFAEILARSKADSVSTEVTQFENREDNKVSFSTSMLVQFSLVNAKSKDVEWLNRIARER